MLGVFLWSLTSITFLQLWPGSHVVNQTGWNRCNHLSLLCASDLQSCLIAMPCKLITPQNVYPSRHTLLQQLYVIKYKMVGPSHPKSSQQILRLTNIPGWATHTGDAIS